MPCFRRDHQKAGGGGAGSRSKQSNAVPVAVEILRIIVYPLQGHRLIQNAVIAGRVYVGSAQKSQRAQAIVYRDDDDLVKRRHYVAGEQI